MLTFDKHDFLSLVRENEGLRIENEAFRKNSSSVAGVVITESAIHGMLECFAPFARENKIPMIKAIRVLTGLGLKDAKDMYERWYPAERFY